MAKRPHHHDSTGAPPPAPVAVAVTAILTNIIALSFGMGTKWSEWRSRKP